MFSDSQRYFFELIPKPEIDLKDQKINFVKIDNEKVSSKNFHFRRIKESFSDLDYRILRLLGEKTKLDSNSINKSVHENGNFKKFYCKQKKEIYFFLDFSLLFYFLGTNALQILFVQQKKNNVKF